MGAKFSLPGGCASFQVGIRAWVPPHPVALPVPSAGDPRHGPGRAVRPRVRRLNTEILWLSRRAQGSGSWPPG